MILPISQPIWITFKICTYRISIVSISDGVKISRNLIGMQNLHFFFFQKIYFYFIIYFNLFNIFFSNAFSTPIYESSYYTRWRNFKYFQPPFGLIAFTRLKFQFSTYAYSKLLFFDKPLIFGPSLTEFSLSKLFLNPFVFGVNKYIGKD